MDETKLDVFDRKIIRALVRDGRMTWRELAEEIGLSLTPTLRRVRKLESDKYIVGYTARVDERRLFGAIEALISVTLERQSEEALVSFEKNVRNVKEVTDCFQVTGDYDYILRVVVNDLDHYQDMIGALSRIPMLSRINSSFVLKAVLHREIHVT